VSDTATRALDQVGVAEGQTLLVSGAAGGVGTAIVQLARLRGITVIGTASATKHDYLRELGAVPTTYGEGQEERVRELAPGSVDAAIDVATWVAFRRLMPSPVMAKSSQSSRS
jgi:NADPH:quinone reductase-like Zn-dependent oxidoreductase